MKKMKPGELIVTALAVVAAVWAVAFAVLSWGGGIVIGREPYPYGGPTVLGNKGRTVVSAIRVVDKDREASGAGGLWPAKGAWASSTDYLDHLLELEDCALCKSDVDGPWCCLAGIAGEDDSMPFLWTDNLEVTDAMLRGEDVDWGGQLRDEEPVVIVRKSGDMQIVKKKQLSAETFFNMSWGGGLPRDPDALEVLKPLPAPESTGEGRP